MALKIQDFALYLGAPCQICEDDFAKRLYNEAKAQGQLQSILSTTPHAGATQTPQILQRLRVLAENENLLTT